MAAIRAIRKALSVPPLVLEYQSLLRTQLHAPREFDKIQSAKLVELLHAAKNIKFYRDRLQKTSSDPSLLFQCIQPVSKRDLRDAPLEMRVLPGTNFDQLVRLHTSGTTAEPFEVVLSLKEKTRRVLLDIRALQVNGIGCRDLTLSFRHLKNITGASARESFFGFFPRAYASFELTAAERLQLVESLHPQAVAAQPSTFVPMAELVQKKAEKPLGLKRLVSYAEFLDNNQRQLIEECFGVPVIDHYGTIEVGFIAWQCPLTSELHVNAETHILEAVDESGVPVPDGEPGELLVTSLLQKTHPFIRYRTGDRGSISRDKCVCGRGLPSLRLLRGRTIDRLYDVMGNEISPHFFTILWEGIDGILQFQAIQQSYREILYRYVCGAHVDIAALETEVTGRIREFLGKSAMIHFERVNHIEAEPGGKVKSFISLINPQPQ